jgi:hypothetical protein
MNSMLRRFVALVLLLALPFQGMAAATMFLCSVPVTVASASASASAAHHCDEVIDQSVSLDSSQKSSASCHLCDVCCHLAAIIPAFLKVDLVADQPYFRLLGMQSGPEPVIAGPMRPPRLVLA